jgi:hypothetical protein
MTIRKRNQNDLPFKGARISKMSSSFARTLAITNRQNGKKAQSKIVK